MVGPPSENKGERWDPPLWGVPPPYSREGGLLFFMILELSDEREREGHTMSFLRQHEEE